MIEPQRQRRISAIPTASGGIARAALARLKQSSLTVEPLVRRSGLSLPQLDDPDQRIAVNDQVKFLNLAAEAIPDEFLGFHLAAHVDLRELGLLYYIQTSSDTLGDAFRRVQRYCSIQNEGVVVRCLSNEKFSVTFEYRGIRRLMDRHQLEFFAAIIVRLSRQLTGRDILPDRVELAHRRSGVPAEVTRFFGCKVVFGADVDLIEYEPCLVLSPLISADTYLNRLLTRYCEEALSRRRSSGRSWRSSVENVLAPLLPHGVAKFSEVAKRLSVSERTLARRLADEGETFNKILDDARRDLAGAYLQEPGLPINEIAWLLGYSEPAAFNHAFRRWNGISPGQTRTQPTKPRSDRPVVAAMSGNQNNG